MDLEAAVSFVATRGRVVDRRRLDVLLGRGSAAGVVAALDAYRNADGGYGWGLEPDHRSVTSQPVAAMHALEALAEVRDVSSSRPVELCDWLADHSLADGGVPFGLPCADTVGCAPHWVAADSTVSSLQMTAQLAGQAHRLARFRADVDGHPWLAAATSYCLAAIDRLSAAPNAYELMFVLRFLDAAADRVPGAGALVERFARYVVSGGPTPVVGGADGEALRLLDFTPYAGAPSRGVFGADAVAAELERVVAGQQDDGGWTVDFAAFSPAAALEWRGYVTVQVVGMVRGGTL